MDFFTNDPPNNELEESFLTAPTDSYKPDQAREDGAAKIPSLAYTISVCRRTGSRTTKPRRNVHLRTKR